MSFYNKPVSVTVSKFSEPSDRIIEPKQEVVGTHIYSWWVRNTGDDVWLEIGIWSWRHGMSLAGTELLTCESWCCLQGDTEFACTGYPAGVVENSLMGGKNPNIWWPKVSALQCPVSSKGGAPRRKSEDFLLCDKMREMVCIFKKWSFFFPFKRL